MGLDGGGSICGGECNGSIVVIGWEMMKRVFNVFLNGM